MDLFGQPKPPRPLTREELSFPDTSQGWNEGMAFAAIATDSELAHEITKARADERRKIEGSHYNDRQFNRASAYHAALEWVQHERLRKYRERKMLRV